MNIILFLYRFFRSRRPLLFAFAIASVALCLIPVSKLKLEEDIAQFLPKTEGIEKINTALKKMKIQDKMAINIHLADSSVVDEELLIEMADLFADSINRHFDSSLVAELKYKQADETLSEVYNFYTRHLPVFLEKENYKHLEQILHKDSINEIVKLHYRNLISPVGVITGKLIQSDPLNLTLLALKKLQGLQLDEKIEIHDGYFFSSDHKNLLIFLTPSFKSSENEKCRLLIDYLDRMRSCVLKTTSNKVELEYYGGPAVAVSNSNCIKKDTGYTSTISILLIVLVLLFYFRSFRYMVILLIPVVFGALFALMFVYLIKGGISIIALGAGSIVLGIAINYSLHILTHYKHYGKVEVVLKDLSKPMFLGCLTTVAAFFSLLFVESEALNDFGLFAGFCLIGTLLFSFTIMPHLFSGKDNKENKNSLLDHVSDWQPHKNKWILVAVILSAVTLAFYSGDVEFEKDMRTLSYESPELKKWHNNLDKINNYTQQSIFVSVTASSREQALQQNEQIGRRISSLKGIHPQIQYSGLSGIVLSNKEQHERIQLWEQFWSPERVSTFKKNLQYSAAGYGFAEDAFNPFLDLLSQKPRPISEENMNGFIELIGSGMINSEDSSTTIYSIVKAEKEAKQELYQWGLNDNVTVFDNARITSLFAESVANDFQTILLITALLVFGFMLLSHGRIETTVINFLPMLISWFCILGFMALFGITFNLINIVISTFVFGLGDDYSIFILDGLSNEYKYGRKVISSYKASILLSALITIIGIGVLLFTNHPALKSVALIAVLGIIVVIVISFVIQPLVYNWLILKRVKKGLPPYTAVNLIITAAGFFVFTLGSLLLTILGVVIFYGLPFINRDKRKVWFHMALMTVNKIILAIFINVKKTIIHSAGSEIGKPAIIIANHQSHIDLALIMQLHPKIIFFTNDWVWNSPFYGMIVRMADFYPASRGYENAAVQLKPLIDKGYSVMIFPEGTRSIDGNIHRFHKGAFYLQEKLSLDILPILIHGAGDCVTKGDFHFKKGKLTVKLLPRIKASDSSPGKEYKERSKWICNYLRYELGILKKELETGHYYRSRLISNFIYKGPVLEWYTRIKTRMENNYELFDSLLPKAGTITDVGCGYGYLAYTLGYTSPKRKILGLDYDEDKILLANNCFSKKTLDIDFVCADIMEYDLPDSDGIAVLDVLHYLEPEQQIICIHKFLDRLNKGGILIIRDANADMKGKHTGTKYTEFFSTNTGFNKKTSKGLSFVSSKLIENCISKRGGFSCEIIDNTRYLSNLVYIVRHMS